MKISLRWLNEFVDIEDYFSKPQELSDLLTFAGLEVESLENQATHYEHVVTGLILKKEPHPDAERLTVCQVTTGQGVVHQIVCGAKNHSENDRVVVALPGAKLPNGLEIKESILRNVASKGMLCSSEELGLLQTSDGILILPEEAPIGESFAKYYGLDDIVLELKVTPNRADCLSHLGLARELACLLGRSLKEVPSFALSLGEEPANPVHVKVSDLEACPVYLGQYFSDVTVAPSPNWLKKRLQLLGIKSINNVVDVTNYVMLERGQPLHAFDAGTIEGAQVQVRLSQKNEPFCTLDGTQLQLPKGMLCIADDSKVLAVAGVIGGQGSGVSDQTKTVFLEAAVFKADLVRKTSRSLGIQTDSAYRFSRGVDANSVKSHLLRAIELLVQVAGAKPCGHFVVGANEVRASFSISIDPQFVSQKLGYAVKPEDFEKKMSQLGCLVQVDESQLGFYQVSPPSFRFDLETSVDLVEEYGRLNGYDKIPENLPSQTTAPSPHQKEYLFHRQLAKSFTAQGFNELVLPLFTDSGLEQEFYGLNKSMTEWGFAEGEAVRLLNPLSEEQASLRRFLSFGLANRALYNLRQGLNQGQLFEVGVVAAKKNEYHESYHLAAVAWGEPNQVWDKKQECPLIIRFKDQVLQSCNATITGIDIDKVADRSQLPDCLHMGQSAWLTLKGSRVGFIGQIHPGWTSEHKVRVPLCMMELNLTSCLPLFGNKVEFQSFSRYPYVERDLALVAPRNLASKALEVCFQKSLTKYLQSVDLFDIYEGDKLPPGHRQLGYRLRLQKEDGTLSDAEVTQALDELLVKLKTELGVNLREA